MTVLKHAPDLEAAADNVVMHRVTGAFADSSHESAFAIQLFRLAYPFHVLLLLLDLAIGTFMVFDVVPELRPLWITIALCGLFGLVGRVLLHQKHDRARAQQLGSWTWTAVLLVCTTADFGASVMASAAVCMPTQEKYLAPILLIATALINGAHGLSFPHKTALIGVILVDDLVLVAFCGSIAFGVALCQAGVVIVGYVVAHLAELFMRQSYAEKAEKMVQEDKQHGETQQLAVRNEQLQAEKERLLYDVQRRGRPLDNDTDRNAIRRGLLSAAGRPFHSSDDAEELSEAGCPPSESAPPTLPPGPPSTAGGSVAPRPTWAELDQQFHAENAENAMRRASPSTSNRSKRSRLDGPDRISQQLLPRPKIKQTQPVPLTWAEADRQHFEQVATREKVEQRKEQQRTASLTWAEADRHFAEMAARDEIERRMDQRQPDSLTWAAADRQHFAEMAARPAIERVEQRTAPLTCAEAADRQQFAAMAAGSAIKQRVAPLVALPGAEAVRQWHAERTAEECAGVSASETLSAVEASLLGRELRELAAVVQRDETDLVAMAEIADDDVVAALAPHIVSCGNV